MKHDFWLERWEQNQIGFHQVEINQYLTNHWAELGLARGDRVFVPLCGKSLDMLWLREQGQLVLGNELSAKAVEAFFSDNKQSAVVSEEPPFSRYAMEGLEILAGDFFALTRAKLGDVSAVYDRAALIALPPEMRKAYACHISSLLQEGAHILLVTMEYPSGTLEGPPFSVSEEEVHALFAEDFSVELRAAWVGAEGPRGVNVTERVYILTRRGAEA